MIRRLSQAVNRPSQPEGDNKGMYELCGKDGEVIASYSGSFTLLEILSDAMERKYLPAEFSAAWAAATPQWGHYLVIGVNMVAVTYTGYTLRKVTN